jgi:hypothetical protein
MTTGFDTSLNPGRADVVWRGAPKPNCTKYPANWDDRPAVGNCHTMLFANVTHRSKIQSIAVYMSTCVR